MQKMEKIQKIQKNICASDKNDQFARYKRDELHLISKGVQIQITNLDRIARQLKVESKSIRREMQKMLGIPISKGDVVNGLISLEKLEDCLQNILTNLFCVNGAVYLN